MKELEFLKEQNVSEDLIHGVEEFRKNYGVDEAAAARVTRPSIPFYGSNPEMAIAGLLEGKISSLQVRKPPEKISWPKIWLMLLAALNPQCIVSCQHKQRGSHRNGKDVVNNEVCLRKGTSYQCAEYGGFGILDEINMAKNDAVSVLHATLDYRRSIDVPGYDGLISIRRHVLSEP